MPGESKYLPFRIYGGIWGKVMQDPELGGYETILHDEKGLALTIPNMTALRALRDWLNLVDAKYGGEK